MTKTASIPLAFLLLSLTATPLVAAAPQVAGQAAEECQYHDEFYCIIKDRVGDFFDCVVYNRCPDLTAPAQAATRAAPADTCDPDEVYCHLREAADYYYYCVTQGRCLD